MRTVYPKRMVAHVWAHRSQPSARTQNGSMYFEGDTIYSYGDHFPIARHVSNQRGQRAVLFTTREYSVTTAAHKSAVRSACHHLTVFHVEHPLGPDTRQEQFAAYKQQLDGLLLRYTRARKYKASAIEAMERVVAEANAFATFFDLPERLEMPLDLEAAQAEVREQLRKQRIAEQAEIQERARRAELARAEAEKALDAWARGGSRLLANDAYGLPIRLRIVGDNVETSRGAEFPLEHGKRAYRFIKALVERGETYQHNGHSIHLGHFAIDSIDAQGNVKAGCHDVAFDEIARIAELAGVI